MANESVNRMRAFWGARNARERVFLGVGGAVLLLGLVYGLVYQPIAQARDKLARRLPEERAALRLMRAQAAEIEYLRRHAPKADGTAASLTRVVEGSAVAHNLRQPIEGIASLGEGRLRLTTLPHPATAWVAWLADLERQGVRVQSCRITLTDASGLATLEAILGGGRP